PTIVIPVAQSTAPTADHVKKRRRGICPTPATTVTKVRTIGTNRPMTSALLPYLSKKLIVSSKHFRLRHRPSRAYRVGPIARPITQPATFPANATVERMRQASHRGMLMWPWWMNSPIANRSESPGRIGKKSPHSTKTMATLTQKNAVPNVLRRYSGSIHGKRSVTFQGYGGESRNAAFDYN